MKIKNTIFKKKKEEKARQKNIKKKSKYSGCINKMTKKVRKTRIFLISGSVQKSSAKLL